MNKSLLVEKIMHPDVLKSIKKSVSRLAAKPENRGGRIPCEYCRANEKFENEHEVLEHIKSMHPIQCPGRYFQSLPWQKMVFCYQNCSDLLRQKNCFSDREKF